MGVESGEVSHFMGRDTEAQRGVVSGLRPHSKSVAKLGLAPRTLIS